MYLAKKFNLKRFNIKKILAGKLKKGESQTTESNKEAVQTKSQKEYAALKAGGTVILNPTMGVSLLGYCLIFSPTFFKNFGGLCRDTFLWGEEYILAGACFGLNHKLLYSNELMALHEDNGSKSIRTMENDEEKRLQKTAKIAVRSDIAAIKVHMHKNNSEYLRKVLNPKIDEYDVI